MKKPFLKRHARTSAAIAIAIVAILAAPTSTALHVRAVQGVGFACWSYTIYSEDVDGQLAELAGTPASEPPEFYIAYGVDNGAFVKPDGGAIGAEHQMEAAAVLEDAEYDESTTKLTLMPFASYQKLPVYRLDFGVTLAKDLGEEEPPIIIDCYAAPGAVEFANTIQQGMFGTPGASATFAGGCIGIIDWTGLLLPITSCGAAGYGCPPPTPIAMDVDIPVEFGMSAAAWLLSPVIELRGDFMGAGIGECVNV